MTLPDLTPQRGEPAAAELPQAPVSPSSLWHLPDFLKFWAGQSVSKLGDNVGQLAQSLLLLQLTGDPLTLGFAEAAYFVPYLVLGLPAGALADRLPRRRIMMLCDATRALTFAALAVLLLGGLLRRDTVWVVYAIAALNGIATIFFDVGYLAATPNLVAPGQLLAANGALQVSESVSQLAGPPLAGVIFGAFGAALSLGADAASFAISFVSLALIPHEFRRAPQGAMEDAAPAPRLGRAIREGLRFVWGQPALRWTMLLIASSNFFNNALFPLMLFRMRETDHFSAATIGVILAGLAAGGILGSTVAGRIGKRLGMMRTALVFEALTALYPMLFFFTAQGWLLATVLFIGGMGNVIINVNVLTLRQSITPDAMLSRVQSVSRVIAWSLIPAGSIAGPALAVPLGVPAVLIGGSVLAALIALGLFLSPVRRLG